MDHRYLESTTLLFLSLFSTGILRSLKSKHSMAMLLNLTRHVIGLALQPTTSDFEARQLVFPSLAQVLRIPFLGIDYGSVNNAKHFASKSDERGRTSKKCDGGGDGDLGMSKVEVRSSSSNC